MVPMTVVLATDSFLIGDGLVAMLADVDDVTVIGRVRDHEGLLRMVEQLTPDAVILSLRNPVYATMATIQAARRLRRENPGLGIVVVSDRGNGFALELLRDGAARVAFLLDDKLPDIDAVLDALREVRAGRTILDPSIVDALVHGGPAAGPERLTLRESDVLEQLAGGLSNRAIAAEVHLSTKAVEKYITMIFRKLDLTDPTLVDRRVSAALSYLRFQTDPLLGLVRTASDAHRLQQARALGRATLAAVCESTSTGLVLSDAQGGHITMDDTARELYEFSADVDLSTNPERLRDDWELTSADGQLIDYDSWPLTRATRGDFVREMELHFRSLRTGREWDCSLNVVPVRDTDGHVTRIVQTLRDVTVPKAAERELIRQQHLLEQEGLVDALTGVPDRRHFLALANHELARAHGAQRPLTIAMVDIDHFKDVNSRLGPAGGDRALVSLVSHIENLLRPGDVLGRLEADQFLLLLPGTDLGETDELIARLRQALSSDPFDPGDDGSVISISAGAAAWSGTSERIDELIASADAALYSEKRRRPEA